MSPNFPRGHTLQETRGGPEVFRHLRAELGIEVAQAPKTLPYVPTENEIRRYYQTVWTARRSGDIVLIKTLLYTGVRVAELVSIRLGDVDLDACRIRITQGKGAKDRYVPFPATFKETPRPAHQRRPGQRRGLPIRVFMEKAVLHPRRPRHARPIRRQGRTGAQHAATPAQALPVHLAERAQSCIRCNIPSLA